MSAAFTNTPDPDDTPPPIPPAERLRELLRECTPDRVTLDAETVATVLYVSPFTPRQWRRMGPAHLARYVAGVAADPQFRVPELVALVTVTEQLGRTDTARLAAARRVARRVVAALSN